MTIPGLIIINLLAGASVAFGARVQIKNLQRPIFSNRYFSALMMMEIFLFIPVGLYYAGFYPDWSWMYLLDTNTTVSGINVMAFASYPVSATLGFLVGYFSARSGADWVTLMFIGFLVTGLAGLFVVAGDKLGNLGTFEQYHRNVEMHPWHATSLLPSVLLTWLAVGICWTYLLVRFTREGQLSRSARS